MLSIQKFILLIFFICISFFNSASAQKFLALDVYHLTGNMKRVHFRIKDKISFKEKGSRNLYTGIIMEISDTSFSIKKNEFVCIKDVSCIIIDKYNFITRSIPNFLMGMGAGFIALDSFNNLMNGDYPVIKKQTLIEGATFVACGWILLRFSKENHRISSRCTLKIIDISP